MASAIPTATATPLPMCAGDCNHNLHVTVDELIRGIDIALGVTPLNDCMSLDTNGDSRVTVDELAHAVSNALIGCR